MGYDIKQKIENVYEQDITFLQNVTVTGNFTANGTFTFGDAAVDNFILKGRMSTMTAAGAGVDINATYINTYQELWEIRGTVSAWGTKDSFKLIYMRAQADLGVAGGLRCAEFYSVMNTSTTTGLSSLQNVYAEMLIRASASDRTLTNAHCIEANISVENQTGTLTLSNNIYCLYAKAQTGTGIDDYTKINGIRVSGRDDGTARVFGNALDICNPEATVCTWTKGINISTKCATGMSIGTNSTRGFLIGAPWAGAGSTGMKILTDNTTWDVGATVGIYFDDGGSALTAWGEGFTVGTAILSNSTGQAQTGWPYTAFFYMDIHANIDANAANHWPGVMMNFAIASGKTLAGFDNHGCSTLHLSVDVNGTLSSETTIANLSFGGNSTGTINGKWVCMHVRDTTGDFSALLKLDTNATGCYTTSYSGNDTWIPGNKGTFTQAGQIRILIGGDTYYIPYGTVA